MKLIRIGANKYQGIKGSIWASISGKRIPFIKEVNLHFGIDGNNTFEIVTKKETLSGTLIGFDGHYAGKIE